MPRASNSGATVQAVTIPTTIRPVSSPVTSSTAWRTAAAAASAARACGRAAAPAPVSVATRPDRSISGAPRSRSSWRICALTPDWLTCTRSRGPGEVRVLGDRDEVLQLPQFHSQ